MNDVRNLLSAIAWIHPVMHDMAPINQGAI